MNKIKELRIANGWTQDELGAKLCVKRAAISKYETGKIPLTDDTIGKLVKIFNKSADYILGIEDKTTTCIESNDIGVEDKLLKKLRNLDDESKKELEKYMDLLKLKQEIDKSKNETPSSLNQA
ncbi:XRE family transcriptional regulator [Clostridium botulinum]|uniref:XRE family transcriptional regulator n=1 Tax=Clostridium botulinum TaxID=1491 RepID=A0A6M0SRC9_CLOBO|nr:XRE family transcriptional regulator [Clostridium botulinum]NFO10958.1 helix-turn-helix transcriptional regulator [Clostridium botulinum]